MSRANAHPQPLPARRRLWRLGWIVAALVAIVPVVVIALYSQRLADESVRRLVRSNNAVASQVAREMIDRHMMHHLELGQTLARLASLIEGTRQRDVAAVREPLRHLVEANSDVDRAFIIDTKGVLWADWPVAPESLGQSFAHRDYFRGLSRDWRPYVSEVFQRQAAPRPLVVAIACPIRDAHDNVLGGLVFQWRLDSIGGWLRNVTVGTGGHLVVLDQRGVVAGHPLLDVQAMLRREYADLPPVREALGGRSGLAEYRDPITGHTMVAAFSPVPLVTGGHWTVIAQQERDRAYAPIAEMHTQIAIAVAIVAAMAVGAAMWLAAVSERSRRMHQRLAEANIELRQSEHRYRAVIEQSSEAIYIADPQDRRVLDCNPAFCKLLGYSLDEARRLTIYDFVAHPPGNIDARVATVMAEGAASYGERDYRRKDGSTITVAVNATVIEYDGRRVMCSMALDVTEARRVQRERDRFFTISRDLLCIAGFDGRFRRLNDAWTKTLGYTEEELLASPWMDFVHPDDRASTEAEGGKLSAGAITLHFENRYRCKDGTYRWLDWTGVPEADQKLIFAVARDITDRKQAERQLQEKNRQLEEAVRSERQAHEQLKQTQAQLVQSEKLAALGQMVAGVAHEINNPLSFVSNNAVVLQRDVAALRELLERYRQGDPLIEAQRPELHASIRELAERIDLAYTLANLDPLLARSREGLRRIQQIVADLRDFARMGETVFEEADLNAGIQSTVNIVRGQATRKQVTIELDLGPLPPVVCSRGNINQVVLNLLSNAIDACRAGGVVRVVTRGDETEVRIAVEDTGCGIPPEIRGRIFDPFFTTKPPGEGTGLGLSISHGIVRNHGGSIDIESEVGRGSRFTVRLPRRKA